MCEKVTIYWLIEIWIVSIGYQINANHALLLAGIRSVYRSKNSIKSDFSISLLNYFFFFIHSHLIQRIHKAWTQDDQQKTFFFECSDCSLID